MLSHYLVMWLAGCWLKEFESELSVEARGNESVSLEGQKKRSYFRRRSEKDSAGPVKSTQDEYGTNNVKYVATRCNIMQMTAVWNFPKMEYFGQEKTNIWFLPK